MWNRYVLVAFKSSKNIRFSSNFCHASWPSKGFQHSYKKHITVLQVISRQDQTQCRHWTKYTLRLQNDERQSSRIEDSAPSSNYRLAPGTSAVVTELDTEMAGILIGILKARHQLSASLLMIFFWSISDVCPRFIYILTPGTSTVYPEIHSEMAAKVIGILIISSVVEARFSTRGQCYFYCLHQNPVLAYFSTFCTRLQKGPWKKVK